MPQEPRTGLGRPRRSRGGAASGRVIIAIYFLHDRQRNLVRIGTTRRDPESRIAEHQAKHGHRLVLVKVLPGGRDVEKRIHGLLAEYRAHGEWFHVSRFVESHIGVPLCPAEPPPPVRFLEDPAPEHPAPSGPADLLREVTKQIPSGPAELLPEVRKQSPSGPADHFVGADDMMSIGCHHGWRQQHAPEQAG